jgi:hypothetical protein
MMVEFEPPPVASSATPEHSLALLKILEGGNLSFVRAAIRRMSA